MPPNQSPLANILQWFQGGRNPQNQGYRQGPPNFHGYPYGPPSGPNPFPNPFGAGPPAPYPQSNNPGPFGLGDFLRNLRNIDLSKVMEGINTFRSFLSNAQKVASTLQQLGTTINNVQKIMSQIDVSGLLNLLSSDSSSSEDVNNEDTSDTPSDAKTSPPKKKKSSTPKRKRKKIKRKNLKKRRANRIKTKKSVPLFKIPQ